MTGHRISYNDLRITATCNDTLEQAINVLGTLKKGLLKENYSNYLFLVECHSAYNTRRMR